MSHSKLRDDATKTKQRCVDEVAQADFRTDAEWGECGDVLPRAEVARVAFLLVEESAAGKDDSEIRGSSSGGLSDQPTSRLAD
jgi:hypothetical protein